eukprot:3381939-Amphidinium_carterae.1
MPLGCKQAQTLDAGAGKAALLDVSACSKPSAKLHEAPCNAHDIAALSPKKLKTRSELMLVFRRAASRGSADSARPSAMQACHLK